jgi:hypothetical protein
MMKKRVLFFGMPMALILSFVFFTGCPGADDPVKSGENLITGFTLHTVAGTINDEANTIIVILPEGTATTGTPVITVSEKATFDKLEGQDFSNDISCTVTAENGTARTYTIKVYVVSPALTNAIYGGGTPQANNTGWLTLAFKADGKVVAAFNADNTTNEWQYVYDSAKKQGMITNPSGGWNPAPDGFTISGDTKTLTITNYGFHGGDPRDFKRLRQGDLTVDPVPFTPGTGITKEGLYDSVWGGSTPQANNTGWLTITLKNVTGTEGATGLRAICSFSADNTTNDWNWEDYDDTTRSGTIARDGGGWTPGAYTISQDGKTLVFGNYMGGERSFSRLR